MPNEDKKKVEWKVLESIDDLLVDGEAQEMDLEDDAWGFGAPPPAGVYDFKCFIGKDGIRSTGEGKDMRLQITVEAHLKNNTDWDGAVAYAYLDTNIYRGKKLSTMMAFLVKLYGVEQCKKLAPLTPKRVGGYVAKALRKEPVIKAMLDWKGSFRYTNNKGDEVYSNKFNHYEDFPVDPENKGGRLHLVTVVGPDKQQHEVRAQTFIERFLGKNEESKPKSAAKVVVEEPDLEEEQVKTPTVAKNPEKVVTSAKTVDEESEELMLQD